MKKFVLSLGLIVNSCFFAGADQIQPELKGKMEALRSKIERVFIPLSQDKKLSSNLNLNRKQDTEEHFLRNLYFYLYLKTIKDLNAGQVQNFAAPQENWEIPFEEGYAKKNKNEIIAIYNRFKGNGDTLSNDDRIKVLQLSIKRGVANVALRGIPPVPGMGIPPVPGMGIPPPPGGVAINPAIQVPFWGNIQNNGIFDLTEIEALFKNLNKKLFELKLKDEFAAMRSRLQDLITKNLNPAMDKELDAFIQNFVPIFYNFSQLMQQRFRRNGQVIEDLSNIQKDIKSVVVTLKFLCKEGLNLEAEIIRILSDLVQDTETFATNFFDNILMNRKQYLHTISLIRKTFNKPNDTAEAKTNRLKELAQEKIAAETIKTYTKILNIPGINEGKKQEIRQLINNLQTNGYQDNQDINFTRLELGLIKGSMPTFKSLTDSIAKLNRLVNNNVVPHNEVEDVAAQQIAEAARLQKEQEENQLINEINDLLTKKNEGERYSVAEFLIEVYRQKHDKFSTKNDKGKEIVMNGDNAAKAKALLDELVAIKAENNEPMFDIANRRPDKATYRTTYTDLIKIVCAECVRLIYKTENMKIGGQNTVSQAIDEIESAKKNANAMYGVEATFGIVMKSIKKWIKEDGDKYCRLILKLVKLEEGLKNKTKARINQNVGENQNVDQGIMNAYGMKKPMQQIKDALENIIIPKDKQYNLDGLAANINDLKNAVNSLEELLPQRNEQPGNNQEQQNEQLVANENHEERQVEGNNLQQENNLQNPQFEELQRLNATLSTQLKNLRQQMEALRQENNRLEQENIGLIRTNTNLTDENGRLTNRNQELAEQINQLNREKTDLNNRITELQRENIGRAETAKHVARNAMENDLRNDIENAVRNELEEKHNAHVASLNYDNGLALKAKDDEIRGLKNLLDKNGIEYVGRGSSTVFKEDEGSKEDKKQLEITVKHQNEVIIRNEAELKKNADTIKKLEITVNKQRKELEGIKNKNESEDDKNLLEMIEEKQKMMESLQKELEDKETLQNKKQAELDAREKQLKQREQGMNSKNSRNSRLLQKKMNSMSNKNKVESSNKDVKALAAAAA